MVCPWKQGVRSTARVRTTDHRPLAKRPRPEQSLVNVLSLDVHSADHDEVSPKDVTVQQRFKTSIDQPQLPILRTERGRGQQTQGGMDGFFGNEIHHSRKAPERGGETRPNHKNLDACAERRKAVRMAAVLG